MQIDIYPPIYYTLFPANCKNILFGIYHHSVCFFRNRGRINNRITHTVLLFVQIMFSIAQYAQIDLQNIYCASEFSFTHSLDFAFKI